MRIYLFLLFFITVTILNAQDTIRVMHYNLLYYGNSSFCNESNNNTDQKDAFLTSILTYSKPDIITVNEMSYLSTFQERMLSEVMNQAGYALFDMVPGSNQAQSSIMNVLYYNTEKLGYHSKATAQDEIRDIDVFRLYSLEVGLEAGDTIFLTCVVAHLKAGDGSDDENDRLVMTQNTLNYLEENATPGNYLFMGDFNFQKSSEDAYQLMTTNNDPVFRFYDPADEEGNWHNNSSYRFVHTQSTRSSNTGCGAWGGMDDRFDFIMMNELIHDQSDRVGYIEDSYYALGQDGQRFNGSISDPPNTSVPAYIVDALEGMSDHLPVVMDLLIADDLGTSEFRYQISDIRYQNPVRDELKLVFSDSRTLEFTYSLISTAGVTVLSNHASLSNGSATIELSDVPSGFYILNIQSEIGYFTGKVIVNH
jgi:endonuclease/exonuclease/phosphatase family metal-dependent hydrolase